MIGNAATAGWLSAQYNPEEVTEQLEAVYKDLEVQGLSHEIPQYDHTKSLALSFTLAFDALTGRSIQLSGGLKGAGTPDLARRFLESLLVPTRSASSVASGAPPRALLVWPNLFSLTGILRKLVFHHKRFGTDMGSTWFTTDVTFTEVLATRITSEDVFANGTQR